MIFGGEVSSQNREGVLEMMDLVVEKGFESFNHLNIGVTCTRVNSKFVECGDCGCLYRERN